MSKVCKIVTINDEGHLDIAQFKDLIDVTSVEYYRITHSVKDRSFFVEFFDKDQNPIKPFTSTPKKPKRSSRRVKRAA